MSMSVMNIRHVVVLVFFNGMFVLVRMCACYHFFVWVCMCGVIMPVAVLMEQGGVNVRMGMHLIDQQERTTYHQNTGEAIRK